MRKPGMLSILICIAAVALTLTAGLVCLPAAELLPAQVFPDQRDSGESMVHTLPGSGDAMSFYAARGVEILQLAKNLRSVQKSLAPDNDAAASPGETLVVASWLEKLSADHGEKYGNELSRETYQRLGSSSNVVELLALLRVDKNIVYEIYALFFSLSLLSAAIAVQAMGRWDAEEKTILPLKK